jgi:hypothetical protein
MMELIEPMGAQQRLDWGEQNQNCTFKQTGNVLTADLSRSEKAGASVTIVAQGQLQLQALLDIGAGCNLILLTTLNRLLAQKGPANASLQVKWTNGADTMRIDGVTSHSVYAVAEAQIALRLFEQEVLTTFYVFESLPCPIILGKPWMCEQALRMDLGGNTVSQEDEEGNRQFLPLNANAVATANLKQAQCAATVVIPARSV